MRYKITTLKNHQLITYHLWAYSQMEAEQKAITRDGYKPIEIKESTLFCRFYPINSKSILVSLRQLLLLLEAQTPINKTIDVVHKHCINPRLSSIFATIKKSLENGLSLPESFAPFRGVFGDLCLAMLQAGSKSGEMSKCLKLLIEDLEQREKEKEAIFKALAYPFFVMITTFVCFGVMLVFVVPSFLELLTQNGVALPIYTKILIALFEFVKSYGMYCLIALLCGFVFVGFEYKKRGVIAQALSNVLLLIPYFGSILRLSYLKNYCFSLCVLLRSGVPLLQAHQFAQEGIFLNTLREKVQKIKEALENGKSFSQGMRESGVFDILSISLIDVAQESGRVEEILELCYQQYQKEMQSKISKIIALIEPMLTLLLGSFILLLALGIFVPIWDMGF